MSQGGPILNSVIENAYPNGLRSPGVLGADDIIAQNKTEIDHRNHMHIGYIFD